MNHLVAPFLPPSAKAIDIAQCFLISSAGLGTSVGSILGRKNRVVRHWVGC